MKLWEGYTSVGQGPVSNILGCLQDCIFMVCQFLFRVCEVGIIVCSLSSYVEM